MAFTTVEVDIDLNDFSDDEILEEARDRGLLDEKPEAGMLPSELQKIVDQYLDAKVIGPKELDKWREWAKQ